MSEKVPFQITLGGPVFVKKADGQFEKVTPKNPNGSNPDVWKCDCSGGGCTCTRRDLPAKKSRCDVCNGSCDPMVHMRTMQAKHKARREAEMQKRSQPGGGAPETPEGERNHRRAAAVAEVTALASSIQDRAAQAQTFRNDPTGGQGGGANWSGSALISREQALVQALAQVSRETRDLYIEARREQQAFDAGGAGQAALNPSPARIPGTGANTARVVASAEPVDDPEWEIRKQAMQLVHEGYARTVEIAKLQVLRDNPDLAAEAMGRDSDPIPATRTARTLKAARIAKGLTQKQLASEIGCSHVTIVALEKGAAPVSGLTIYAVSVALGVDPKSL